MVATSGSERRPRQRAQPAAVAGKRAEPEAIFVVGVSRSGTTLLRTVLERSERIAIAMENHYVGHLLRGYGARHHFRPLGDPADDATIRRLVEFIYSGAYQKRSRLREISPYWRWLINEVPRADLEQRLLAAERTEKGMFAAFLRLYADSLDRPVMGEKTPAHLMFVDTLLEWFPRAKVVHIVRDPRAVYVSDSRRRRGRPTPPFSWLMKLPLAFETLMLLQTSLAWARAARIHRRLARTHAESYTMLRFEDLVRTPDETLPGLFDWLGVELPGSATDVKVVSRGYLLGEAGLDAAAADRWRDQLHPFAARLLKLVLGRHMRGLGYPD